VKNVKSIIIYAAAILLCLLIIFPRMGKATPLIPSAPIKEDVKLSGIDRDTESRMFFINGPALIPQSQGNSIGNFVKFLSLISPKSQFVIEDGATSEAKRAPYCANYTPVAKEKNGYVIHVTGLDILEYMAASGIACFLMGFIFEAIRQNF